MTSIVCKTCRSDESHNLVNLSEHIREYVLYCPRCKVGTTNRGKLKSGTGVVFRRFGLIIESLMWVFRVSRALKYGIQKRSFSTKEVLDYGCGRGEFLQTLRFLGWNVLGVEYSQDSACSAVAKSLPVVIQEHFNNMVIENLENESFSLITSFHNLEHLQDPYKFLREAKRVLMSQGSIILEVPNLNSWQSEIGQDAWILLDLENHEFHFTCDGLASLMERSGFQVGRISTLSIQYGILGMVDSITVRTIERCRSILTKNKLHDTASQKPKRNLIYWCIFSLAILPSALLELVASFKKKGGVLRVEGYMNSNNEDCHQSST